MLKHPKSSVSQGKEHYCLSLVAPMPNICPAYISTVSVGLFLITSSYPDPSFTYFLSTCLLNARSVKMTLDGLATC